MSMEKNIKGEGKIKWNTKQNIWRIYKIQNELVVD